MEKIKQKRLALLSLIVFMLLIAPVLLCGCFLNKETSNTVKISTIDDLRQLEYGKVEGKPTLYQLQNDLDFSSVDWENQSMNDKTKIFRHHFDGNGFTIKNLTADGNYASLLGILGGGAKVYNLNFENVDITGTKFLGAVAGGMDNTNAYVYNITVKSGTVGEDDSEYVGGIIGGYSYGSWTTNVYTISNCTNYATIEGKTLLGGITGYGYNFVLKGCKNYGIVTADTNNRVVDEFTNARIGGIVGEANGRDNINVSNNENYGAITSTDLDYVGGIVGMYVGPSGKLDNNVNDAKVLGYNTVGGIVGGFKSVSGKAKVVKSVNKNEVIGTENVGGIVGYASSNVVIESCNNGLFSEMQLDKSDLAKIEGLKNVGGIVGYSAEMIVYRCENRSIVGKDTSTAENVGGIVGYGEDTNLISNRNYYDVYGGKMVGGITGKLKAVNSVVFKGNWIMFGDIHLTGDSTHATSSERTYAGGGIGCLTYSGTNVKTMDFSSCVIMCDIKASHFYGSIGGFIGRLEHSQSPNQTIEQINNIATFNNLSLLVPIKCTTCSYCGSMANSEAVVANYPNMLDNLVDDDMRGLNDEFDSSVSFNKQQESVGE